MQHTFRRGLITPVRTRPSDKQNQTKVIPTQESPIQEQRLMRPSVPLLLLYNTHHGQLLRPHMCDMM